MDQAIINSCMCVRMEGSIARNINIIFGNMSNDGLVMANMTMNSVMDKLEHYLVCWHVVGLPPV